jgi:hypothetical protein
MFHYRWGPGVLCIIVALIWIIPAAAQFDRCFSSTRKIKYGDEIHQSVQANSTSTNNKLLCFEGKRGDSVLITAERVRSEGLIGIALLAPNIPGLGESDFSTSDVARVTYTLPGDGAYTIVVTGGMNESFSYKLTLDNQTTARSTATPRPEVTPTPRATVRPPQPTEIPEDETQNNACAAQSFILIPGYSSGFELEDEQPYVMYCFYGIAGHKYRITADTQTGDLDPLIYVFLGRTEETVAFNDDQSLLNKNAQVDFVPEESGLYIVAVSRVDLGEGDTEGEYVVEIENRTILVPEACPTAFMIPPEGVSIPEGEHGFYAFCFNGEDDQVVSLIAEAHRGDLDLDVYISHPDLTPVDSASSTDETLELAVRIKRDQPFLILIFDNTYEGGFDLTFEQD